ncbi:LacI family DNA-binding transcriptional regulator [Devosia sp. A16]|uniref:LacI family DNA-binding transcriptional regulator n=1 Tax=Devosia sp. A16 TaxID=1736675 RepID=UPI0006D7E472|nr:LacI family DNA-binding transcriptional regulator [Devosia sp. A16]
MVTIKDVAKRANVSFTTVSHVINKTRPVSEDAARRVNAAIADLGYFPSDVARALQSSRTRTIGMIVTTTSNPFFGEVIRGVERACFRHGYTLMICNTDDVATNLVAYMRTLFTKRVDAMVVMTTNASPEFFRRLGQIKRVPVVAIDAPADTVASVFSDDSVEGGRLVGDYLARSRFRRIVCVSGPESHPRMADRIAGLMAGLAAHGIGLDGDWLVRTDLTMDGGLAAARDILSRPGPRPEVIFALSDIMAIGLLHGLHDAGIDIPGEISVVGYDDIESAAHFFPPLTTVRQPIADIGASAAEAAINHLDRGAPLPRSTQLKPELIFRQSARRLVGTD